MKSDKSSSKFEHLHFDWKEKKLKIGIVWSIGKGSNSIFYRREKKRQRSTRHLPESKNARLKNAFSASFQLRQKVFLRFFYLFQFSNENVSIFCNGSVLMATTFFKNSELAIYFQICFFSLAGAPANAATVRWCQRAGNWTGPLYWQVVVLLLMMSSGGRDQINNGRIIKRLFSWSLDRTPYRELRWPSILCDALLVFL